jgi:hypothetical protein
LNSNVALFSMILVAGSGVIGRYIYTHIHTGLSGARLDVGGLLKQATQLMAGIEADVGGSGGTISKALADFSVKATPRNPGFGASLLNLVSMPIQLRVSRAKVMREVRRSIENNTKIGHALKPKPIPARPRIMLTNFFLQCLVPPSLRFGNGCFPCGT